MTRLEKENLEQYGRRTFLGVFAKIQVDSLKAQIADEKRFWRHMPNCWQAKRIIGELEEQLEEWEETLKNSI